jgi:hypothetical protein
MMPSARFFRDLFTRRPRRAVTSHKQREYRPQFDMLEDRWLPSITLSFSSTPLPEPPGTPVSLSLSFSDQDPTHQASYAATVDWGDGTSSTLAVTTDYTGDLVLGSVAGNHAYAQDGTYSFVLTVTGNGDSASQDGSVQVDDGSGTFGGGAQGPVVSVPGGQTSAEGDHVSLQVSASDPEGNSLTYSTIGLPAGLSIDGTGLISGNIDHGDAQTDNGSYTVTVTATDSQGAEGDATFLWTVTVAPPAVTSPGNQSSAEGQTVWLQVGGSDPDGGPMTFGATGLPPGLGIDNGGLISGTA